MGLAIVVLITLSISVPLRAQTAEKIELSIGTVYRIGLDNGLTLLIKESDSPTTTIFFAVKKGSLNEKKAGTSLLTAQCLLEGTKKRSAEEIVTEIETYGGSIAASCDPHLSTMCATTLSEFTNETLEIMSDCILNPKFPKEEVERKKEETLDNLDLAEDIPVLCLLTRFNEIFYKNHPYGVDIADVRKAIPSLTRKDLAKFHKEYYTSDNSVLCIVGDVNVGEVIEKTESLFAKYKRGEISKEKIPPLPPKTKNSRFTERSSKTNSSYVIISYDAPSMVHNEKDLAATQVLSIILGGSPNSRLFKEIREDRGLVYSVSAGYAGQIGPSAFIILFWCDPEKVEEVAFLSLEEVERIKRTGVSKKEVSEAIKLIEESTETSRQMEMVQAMELINYEVLYQDVRFMDKQIEQIKQVTAEDVKRVANEWLGFSISFELRPSNT